MPMSAPKSCLCDNKPASPYQLQGNLVCHDGVVAVGDVGKGTSVDKHRSALCRWKDNSTSNKKTFENVGIPERQKVRKQGRDDRTKQ